MNDFELEQLERELRAMGPSGAPPRLRSRVLADAGRELRRLRSNAWLAYAAAATIVVLWINLSWSATQTSAHVLELRETHSVESRAQLAEQLHELLPELTPWEARRQAAWLERHNRLPQVSTRAAAFGLRPF